MDTNPRSILANITFLVEGHLDPDYVDDCMTDAIMYAKRLRKLIEGGGDQPNWEHHPVAQGFYVGVVATLDPEADLGKRRAVPDESKARAFHIG